MPPFNLCRWLLLLHGFSSSKRRSWNSCTVKQLSLGLAEDYRFYIFVWVMMLMDRCFWCSVTMACDLYRLLIGWNLRYVTSNPVIISSSVSFISAAICVVAKSNALTLHAQLICLAVYILKDICSPLQGFTRLYNISGGIHAYSVKVDDSIPKYWCTSTDNGWCPTYRSFFLAS